MGGVTTRTERLRERFEADPADRACFEALEEHHFLRGEWAALIPIYERFLAATEGTTSALESARLLYRLGHALDEAGVEPERAEDCHRRALEIDPLFAPALRRLRRSCAAARRWDEALALAIREADGVTRPTERAALLAETGAACLRAGEAMLAVQAFEQARAADAGSSRAWLGLGEALEAAGRLEDAIGCWEQTLALGVPQGPERAAAQRALGRLLMETMGDPARALGVYEAAHRASPDQTEWLDGMADALRALGRHDALVALAGRRIERARDPQARAAIALEAGRLLLAAAEDPEAARTWLQRAAELCDSDGDIQLALAEAAGRLGDTVGRTWHLERAMELGAEIPSWSDLGLGGAPPEAPDVARLETLRRAVCDRPTDPDAVAALADALAGGPHDQERAELLERMTAFAGDPAERQEHLLALGELYETRLDDGEAAAASYQMAFDLDPTQPIALEALTRTLRKLDRIGELTAAFVRAAETAPSLRRAELLCAAGDVEVELGRNPNAAFLHYRAALDAEPSYAPAYAGGTRAAAAAGDDATLLALRLREAEYAEAERLAVLVPELVRSLEPEGRIEEALPALRRHVALTAHSRAALERLAATLEELGHTEELSDLLGRLDALLSGAERGANQRRLAWLHAVEGRLEAAIAAWRAALRHEPGDVASLEALLDAFAEADRTEEALALLDDLAARGIDATAGSRSLSLHRARALERGGRLAEANAVWRALYADGVRGEELFTAWERCARGAGDGEALVDVLAEQAAASADPAARQRLDFERASLLEQPLGRPGEARALWQQIADADADPDAEAELGERAAQRLEALLERSGEWAALCDRLAIRSERAAAPVAYQLHIRIAELAETRLDDIDRARRQLQMAVALVPSRTRAWQQLAALYDEQSQPAEWIQALEGELAALADVDDEETRERRLALHVQAARAAEHQLEDAARAGEHWRQVLFLAPDHGEAGEWLLACCAAEGRHEEAAALLRTRLEHTARAAADADRNTDLCLRLADLLTTSLDRPAEAIDVLESAPASGAGARATAERLAALYTHVGRHDECAALCATRADEAREPAMRAQWLARRGDALRAAGDVAGAEAAYEAALDLDPDRLETRTALCDLLRARGDAARLGVHLERALRRAGVGVPALHRELAELLEGPLGTPARALEHWIRLIALDATDREAREHAVALAIELGRLDDAVALLRSAAADARTGVDRAACSARCAELLAGPLDRPDEAIRSWRESLRLEPDQPEIRHRLRVALEAVGRIEEALSELRAEWRATADVAERTQLAAHGADLAAAALPSALGPWLARLVADEPDDPALWTAIAAVHARGGRAAACERALAEAARCAPDAAWRGALHRQRAVWLEGPLDAPSRARAALEGARREDSRHPDVLAALARIYTASDRPREGLEVLSVQLEETRHPALRSALARRAAPLASALGERERAAELWLVALESAAPDQRRALLPQAVDALHAAKQRDLWARFAEEEVTGAGPSPTRARELRRALARTGGATGSHERALAHARALVDDDAADDGDHRLLLSLLRAEGDAVERARRLEDWLQRAPAGREPERAAAWRELAQLREERLADPHGAAEAWRQQLRLDPEAADAWAGLRRCAERAGDARELARALEAEIERGVDPIASRWRRLGRLRWSALGDASGAEVALLAARAAEPEELTALAMLQQIAASTGHPDRAAAVAAEEIEVLGDADPCRRRALWLQIAEIASRQRPDPPRAAHAFEQAHALGPLGATELGAWAAALAATAASDRWCEIFATWCDHPDARPNAEELLALAEALLERGAASEAEARLVRALALDPACADAWRAFARLREQAGDRAGAADAWLRAAENGVGVAAADSWTNAAALLEEASPERALAALEHAAACAPGFAPAEAALARLAEASGRPETAIAAAVRLFAPDTASAAEHISEPVAERDTDPTDAADLPARLAAALAGARAARQLARWPSAWHLAGEALSLDPETPDALAARGLAALHLGATGECRRDLTARLEQSAPDPRRSELLVALARAFENSGDPDAALARHAEALAEEPDHEEAHAGRLRVLERLGHRAEAAAALAAWASHTEPAARRAERYVRAARLARVSGVDRQQVEQWLLEALAAESSHPTAWYELATGLWEDGRTDEALAAASEGAACVASQNVRAVLETVRGRALEARGDEAAARDAYAAAVACDPDAREAALAGARLWRRAGEWQQAAELLRLGAEGHGDAAERAELFFERGRLLAGPLEDVAGALEAYERAQSLAPDRLDVREARAALLGQIPGRDAEAWAELAAVLDVAPLRTDAIRRATRIAQARGDDPSARRGAALLRAFGAASPLERDTAPSRIDLACAAAMPALDATSEALRGAIARVAPTMAAKASDLVDVRPDDPELPDEPPASGSERDARTRSRSLWIDAARTLVGAPDLLTLEPTALRTALDATISAAREGVLGRDGTRAVRRLDGRVLHLVDLSSWRSALRARAWARVVDALDGDLRAVLAEIVIEAGAPASFATGESDDLTPWLADAPEGIALVQALLRAWLAART